MSISALIFFLIIALLFGKITQPTKDELLLLVSSSGLLVFSYIYVKHNKPKKGKEKT